MVKIIPHENAGEAERKRLESYVSSISDFSRLPDVIAEVSTTMGLKQKGQDGFKQFSAHVLSIDVIGPDRPAL